MLRTALPKGRLGDQVFSLFERAGYSCPEMHEESRKLIFTGTGELTQYFWAKPSDVAVYVERGAADIGVVGRDILLEERPDVYELADLHLGRCRMMVAAKEDFRDNVSRTLRVATKFPEIAKRYYESMGRDIELIRLNGSIELAPLVGLSDVIVDIVETGTTLRENHLVPREEIVQISARLIANKSAWQFKRQEMQDLQDRLAALAEEKK